MGTYEIVREGRDLLQSRDSYIGDTLVLTLLQKRVVDLTGTENVSPDLFRGNQFFGVGVGNVSEEVGVTNHLLKIGLGLGVTEEVFREEYNQLKDR